MILLNQRTSLAEEHHLKAEKLGYLSIPGFSLRKTKKHKIKMSLFSVLEINI